MRIDSRHLTADSDGIPGFTASPATGGPHPGLLMVFHANGLTADLKLEAVRLARLGLCVLVPNLYAMLNIPGETHIGQGADIQSRVSDGEFLRVIGDAHRFLAARAGVDAGRIGVIGYCMGSRLAIPFAADTPQLRALALYYPSVRDEPESWLRPRHAFETAKLLTCPSLVIYGGKDHIATASVQQRLWQSFAQNGQPFEWHHYSEGNHGFASSESPGFQPALAERVWPSVADFLQRTLVD